jgi:hypothetical protein
MTTRGWCGVVAMALVSGALFGVGPVRAADSVTGEVVDVACWMHDEKYKGPSHKKCAETCAKKGIPMGILTSDNQLWVLLEDHENPKGYADAKAKAAETITVEGVKVTKGGVQAIIAEEVK